MLGFYTCPFFCKEQFSTQNKGMTDTVMTDNTNTIRYSNVNGTGKVTGRG